VLAGTVTDLVVSDGRCRGVRLVTQGTWATALAGDVVIASGGVSGLFGDGGTGGTGLLLGTCARAGVALDNLEMFHRFALGDLTHGRPLYPFDLHGARLLRDGRPATELTDLLRTTPPQRVDLAAWRSYWVRHQVSRTPRSSRPGRSGWARSAGSAPAVCPSRPRTAVCAACTRRARPGTPSSPTRSWACPGRATSPSERAEPPARRSLGSGLRRPRTGRSDRPIRPGAARGGRAAPAALP
jgi:hypothetical protein